MAIGEASQTIMVRWCEACQVWHEGMLVGVIEWSIPPWCREEHPSGWEDPRLAGVRHALETRPTAFRANSAAAGVPTRTADAVPVLPSGSPGKGAGNGPTTGLAF